MDQTITADTEAPPDRLHAIVADLTSYPEWLDLVTKVEPDVAAATDVGPAYLVTLRAKIGPFARNKRLRMVRTEMATPTRVRFERCETDGRQHSNWSLTSDVTALDENPESRSRVTMHLRYDGQMWSSVLDGALAKVVEAAVPKLQAYART